MRVSSLLALGAGAGTVSAGVINSGTANASPNTLHARTLCLLSGLLPSLFPNHCPPPPPPYNPPPKPTTTPAWTTKTTTPAATTTPSTTARTTTSAAPSPSVCGQAGYDKQTPAASKSDSTGAYGTFSTCKAFCQGSLSFAVGANTCLCYNAPVSGNINPVATSPYLFYDVSCPAPSNGGTTTPAVTTPATTSSVCAPTVTVTVTTTVTKT